MKGAIMQPYLFPYIGYYQLAFEVEKFVFLDDVNYIKKGYINRNTILAQCDQKKFSLPIKKISQNRHICDHNYEKNHSKFLKTIEQAYKKAPFYQAVFPIIINIILDPDLNVARKNAKTITAVFEYLGLKREFLFSSNTPIDSKKRGQDKIIELCQKLEIKRYRNPIGGFDLYDAEEFSSNYIELKFIKSEITPYKQGECEFSPNLSIIDTLMHCNKSIILQQLANYSLI